MKLAALNKDLKIVKEIAKIFSSRKIKEHSLIRVLQHSYNISEIKRSLKLAKELMIIDSKVIRIRTFGNGLLAGRNETGLTKRDLLFFFNLLMFLRHPKTNRLLTLEQWDRSLLNDCRNFDRSYYLKNLWSFDPLVFSIVIKSRWLDDLKQFEALRSIKLQDTKIKELAQANDIDESQFYQLLLKIQKKYPDLLFANSDSVKCWGIPILRWERENELLEKVIIAKAEFPERPEMVSKVSKQKWEIGRYKWRGKPAVGVWGKRGFITWHLREGVGKMKESVIVLDYQKDIPMLEVLLEIGPRGRDLDDLSLEFGLEKNKLNEFLKKVAEDYPDCFTFRKDKASRTAKIIAFSA